MITINTNGVTRLPMNPSPFGAGTELHHSGAQPKGTDMLRLILALTAATVIFHSPASAGERSNCSELPPMLRISCGSDHLGARSTVATLRSVIHSAPAGDTKPGREGGPDGIRSPPSGGGDTGHGDTGSGDTGHGDTGTGDDHSGDTGTGDTGSGDTGSGDTGSGDTGSGDTGSGDTGTGDTSDHGGNPCGGNCGNGNGNGGGNGTGNEGNGNPGNGGNGGGNGNGHGPKK
jgi:hypothetical protein